MKNSLVAILMGMLFIHLQSKSISALSNAEILLHLQTIQKRSPAVSEIFEAGRNDRGDTLYGIRISGTPQISDPSKIGFFIVGGHHGNEPHSVHLGLHLAQTLAYQMQRPSLASLSLAATEWWILPGVNLPGLEKNIRWENRRDPNREYPGPCHTAPHTPLQSVQTVMQTLEQRPFSAAVSLHGYTGTLTSPWGTTTSQPRPAEYPIYEKWLRSASRHNGYRYGTSAEVIYPANGTFEDYVFWKYGMWSLLVELKNGSPLDLVTTTEAILDFVSQVDSSRAPLALQSLSCPTRIMPDLFLE